MKVICSFLAAVLMLVYFSSCQKGIDWELEDIVTNDSTDLSKIVVLDTTLATGQDTLFLLNFYYDNQKRKSGEDFTEIDNSTGMRYTFYYRYFYNNNDTMPYRASEKYSFSSDSLISHLSYANNFIVKDSTVDFISGSIDDIQVVYYSIISASRYLRRFVRYDPISGASTSLDSTHYHRTVNAGNLISGTDSTWQNAGTPILTRANSFQYTYDNKQNPLAPLSLWYLGYYENFDDQVFIDMGVNNLLSARFDNLLPPTSSESQNYSHIYNSLNYPMISIVNGGDGNKALYFYTRL